MCLSMNISNYIVVGNRLVLIWLHSWQKTFAPGCDRMGMILAEKHNNDSLGLLQTFTCTY